MATPGRPAAGARLLCTRRSPSSGSLELPAARRLLDRHDNRAFDLLDVALANEMLRTVGARALQAQAVGSDVVHVTADLEQVTLLHLIASDTTPQTMEAWMLSLAPRLSHDVVGLVGAGWLAEVELSVELSLALRADDVITFAGQLLHGPVAVESTRSAAAVVAVDVPDPALIHFV